MPTGDFPMDGYGWNDAIGWYLPMINPHAAQPPPNLNNLFSFTLTWDNYPRMMTESDLGLTGE